MEFMGTLPDLHSEDTGDGGPMAVALRLCSSLMALGFTALLTPLWGPGQHLREQHGSSTQRWEGQQKAACGHRPGAKPDQRAAR